MRVIEETTIADEALPLAVLKDFLRLGTGFGTENLQDTLLRAFLRAAIATVEARIGQVLLTRVFRLEIKAWRDGVSEVLPLAPAQEILSVDLAGSEPQGLHILENSGRGSLLVGQGGLPALAGGQSLVMRLTVGMAEDWRGLPADLAQAVLMLAAHYYEFRGEQGLDGGCLPFGVSAVLQAHRPMRLGVSQ